MEETLNDHKLLEVVAMLSSKGESGRLQIRVGAMRGAFFFKKGKLADARLGTLTGFPAVNAAVSIREARFSFDPSIPPPTSSFSSLNERIVLKQLFGIETVTPEGGNDQLTVTGAESAFTVPKRVPFSDATDREWSESEPQKNAHKETQEEERIRIRGEQDLEELQAVEDLAERKATIEAQRMADEIGGPIEEGTRKKSDQMERPSIGEREEPAHTPSLAVTSESPANDTDKDSETQLSRAYNRSYSDDLVNGRLDDGALLSASPDLDVTLVKPNAPSSEQQGTSLYALLQSLPSSYRRGLYVAILVVLMGAGAVAFLHARRLPTLSAKPNKSGLGLPAQVSKQSEQKTSGAHNLSGQWKVVNTIEKTSFRSFTNLEIGFRLVINQTGTEFTAKGEKVSENGRILPASGRTPIHLSGSIDGDRIEATFKEEGLRRRTSGTFVWRIKNAGTGLTGTFVSTAARTSGKSAATKEL